MIITFFAALFLCSCEPAAQTGFLRMNIKGEPPTLDPRKGGDALSSTLHFLLFEGLTRLNTNGTVTPAQAESILISEDQKRYTFHLRESFWSDGAPLTASDFESAWKKILSPDFPAPNAHLLYPIKNAEKIKQGKLPLDQLGVHSINARTLSVELEHPTPYFLDLLSFCLFFPIKEKLDTTCPHWAREASSFVSNGPFILQKWQHDSEIKLVKNPYYWKAKEIAIPGIQFSMIAHDMTILHLYEQGKLDLIDMWTSPIPIEAQIELVKKNQMQMRPIAGTTLCVFNTLQFPFNNKHIRRAFALAIDRASIVDHITQLQELPALQLIPPSLKKGDKAPLFQDNDQQKALEELSLGLKELGIEKSDLNQLTYSYCSSERNYKIALVLQEKWHHVLGIKVNLQTYDLKMHMDNLAKRNFQFSQSQWFAQYHDPMSFLERFKNRDNIKNYAAWENQEFNTLLSLSQKELSPDHRFALLKQAEELLIEEMPVTPIYHWNSAVLSQPYLSNVFLYPTGSSDLTRISLRLNPFQE